MKSICLATIMVLVATTLVAQPREGRNVELSLSGSYQHYSSENFSEGSGALLLSPRVGIFLYEGLEFEPEMSMMFAEGSSPEYMLNGLLSYNFTSLGKAVPFLLVGYGIANTTPIFNVPLASYDFSVGVVNVGLGVKAYVAENVALRIEYRYQHFTGEGETQSYGFGYGNSYTYTPKVDVQLHNVQFGFSILI